LGRDWGKLQIASRTWALGQFGDAGVAAAFAGVMDTVDSFLLPRPVDRIGGPGGMSPGGCDWATKYAYADSLVALRPALLAAVAGGSATLNNLEAFDYWAGQHVYSRSIAKFTCDWQTYNAVIAAIQKISDPAQRQAAARALPPPALPHSLAGRGQCRLGGGLRWRCQHWEWLCLARGRQRGRQRDRTWRQRGCTWGCLAPQAYPLLLLLSRCPPLG
jgi:hypothetical protein